MVEPNAPEDARPPPSVPPPRSVPSPSSKSIESNPAEIPKQPDENEDEPPIQQNEAKGSDATTTAGGEGGDAVSTTDDSLQHSESSFPDEYDDKIISSLEPSPAVSVRKTGSFVTIESNEGNADSSSSAGGGIRATTTSQSIQSCPAHSTVQQQQQQQQNPLLEHNRKPSVDTSLASSTLASGINQHSQSTHNNNNSNGVAIKSTIEQQSQTKNPTTSSSSSDHRPTLVSSSLQTVPVNNVSVPAGTAPVALSDVGSIGSVPSALESVGGHVVVGGSGGGGSSQPPGLSHPLTGAQQQQQQQQNSPSTRQTAAAVPLHEDSRPVQPEGSVLSSRADMSGHPQADSLPPTALQHHTHQPSPVIVAVPPQSQHAVYYQVPSVVTLPVDSAGVAGTASVSPGTGQVSAAEPSLDVPIVHHRHHVTTPTHSRTPSSASLITISQPHVPIQASGAIAAGPAVHGDQQVIGISGMVGAIPVVKIQGGGLHYVKKKKGRFNLLQEAVPDQTSVPNNITVPVRSQSPLSAISHGASLPASHAQPPSQQPQTFDGKSAPTVKKKGRFVVTNVKNPGSIRNLQQPPKSSPPETNSETGGGNPGVPVENVSTGESLPPPQQPILDATVNTDRSQPGIVHHPITNAAKVIQPVVIQPIDSYGSNGQPYVSTVHSTVPVDVPYEGVQYTVQSQIPVQQIHPQDSRRIQPVMQPVMHGSVSTVTLPPNVQTDVSSHSQQQQPAGGNIYHHSIQQQQQQHNQYQNPVLETISNSGYSQASPIIIQQHGLPTPPPTPPGPLGSYSTQQGSSTGSNPNLSPSRIDQSSPVLPNIPIPKAPGPSTATSNAATEKQHHRSIAGVPKKKQPQQQPVRGGKLSQNIESGGLGKVFYFLEQMKKEVTDADRCIKSLQSDMKHLRDKNKELEAKNRDLDKKFQDEKALRAKADARIVELKRKLKEATKGETHISMSAKAVEGANQHDENAGRERSSSFSVEKPRNLTRSSTVPSHGKEVATTSGMTPPATSTSIATPTKPKPSVNTHLNGKIPANASPSASTHSLSSEITRRTGASSLPASNKNPHDDNVVGPTAPLIQDRRDGRNETEMKTSSTLMDVTHPPTPSTIKTSTPVKQEQSTAEAPASASAAPPLIPPLQQGQNSTRHMHRHSHSMTDFDPFHMGNSGNSPTSGSIQQSETIETVFLPGSVSFGTLPTYAATPATDTVAVTSDLNGTFMSRNPFVVPVAFGVAPHQAVTTASQAGDFGPVLEDHTHATIAHNGLVTNEFQNGIQQQQFMVVPQIQPQQHFMTAYHYEQQQPAPAAPPHVQSQAHTNVSHAQQAQSQPQPQLQNTGTPSGLSAQSQNKQHQQSSSNGSHSNPQHQFDPMARR